MNLSCRGGVVGALAYIKEGDWRYGVRVDSELWTFHVPEYLQQGKLYFYRVRVHEAQFGGGRKPPWTRVPPAAGGKEVVPEMVDLAATERPA